MAGDEGATLLLEQVQQVSAFSFWQLWLSLLDLVPEIVQFWKPLRREDRLFELVSSEVHFPSPARGTNTSILSRICFTSQLDFGLSIVTMECQNCTFRGDEMQVKIEPHRAYKINEARGRVSDYYQDVGGCLTKLPPECLGDVGRCLTNASYGCPGFGSSAFPGGLSVDFVTGEDEKTINKQIEIIYDIAARTEKTGVYREGDLASVKEALGKILELEAESSLRPNLKT